MRLYLVRHGESVYNAEHRIQGQSDPPLSDLGHRQGQALAEAFRGQTIDAVYSSPLQRSLETAEPVADALSLEVRTERRLMELNAGVFQGLVWSEIVAQYPEDAARWLSQDPEFRIPGGESRYDLTNRGCAALQAIRDTNLPRVVVVAHGGVLCAALKALLGMPPRLNPFRLYNGSISQLEWGDQIKLVTLNQMEHLRRDGVDLCSLTGDL